MSTLKYFNIIPTPTVAISSHDSVFSLIIIPGLGHPSVARLIFQHSISSMRSVNNPKEAALSLGQSHFGKIEFRFYNSTG